jgi:3-deoxy-manno-octulosonate cytidylyltransferase (CMP-KDO synthetase)
MIQWVWEKGVESGIADRVLIATPDEKIFDAAVAFGAEAVMTRDDHPSGTDRLAEVAEKVQADVYVNVQGDEPMVPVESIRACAQPLLNDSSIQMGSIWTPCPAADWDNPAVVKVVTDLEGFALYFSRCSIPYPRGERTLVKRHAGLYAYRREVLQAFATWEPSELELLEGLEQLRFLEHGVRIRMSETVGSDVGIDTPEQAEALRMSLR